MNFVDCIAVGDKALCSQSAANFTSNDKKTWTPSNNPFSQKLGLCGKKWNDALANPASACFPTNAANATCSEPYHFWGLAAPADPAPSRSRHFASHSPLATAAYIEGTARLLGRKTAPVITL
jgi:hypothetical protein